MSVVLFWKVLSAYLRYCQRNNLEQSLQGLAGFAAWLQAEKDKPPQKRDGRKVGVFMLINKVILVSDDFQIGDSVLLLDHETGKDERVRTYTLTSYKTELDNHSEPFAAHQS